MNNPAAVLLRAIPYMKFDSETMAKLFRKSLKNLVSDAELSGYTPSTTEAEDSFDYLNAYINDIENIVEEEEVIEAPEISTDDEWPEEETIIEEIEED